jgi:hypothetical protein
VLLFRSALVSLRASRNSLNFSIHLGALVVCAGLLAHGLADFNLHTCSNAFLFFLRAALASTPAPAARESAYS